MASIALTTADRVHVVESLEQMTLPTGAAIEAGAAVSVDATNGTFVLADADGAGTLGIVYGIATRSVASGETVTAIRRGVLSGWDFSGVSYWVNVLAADTAGEITVTSSESNGGSADVIIGRVVPVWDQLIGGTPTKAVLLTL
jgi:hypothetical protein